MPLNTSLPQPLPILKDLSDSYHCRCHDNSTLIVTPLTNLPSFVFERPDTPNNVFTFCLVDKDGTVIQPIEILQEPCIRSFTDKNGDTINSIAYNFPELTDPAICGKYHVKIENNGLTCYTELLSFVDFDKDKASDYTRIEFCNSCNLENVPFSYKGCSDFKFTFYLDKLAGECCPVRTLEIETEVNQFLDNIELTRSYKKRYKLRTFYLPHYLIDSIYFMTQNDLVNIYPSGFAPSEFSDSCVKDVQIEKIGEDNICCFEQLEITFQREEDIKNLGCCAEVGELECLPCEARFQIGDASDLVVQPVNPPINTTFFINSNTANVTNAWSTCYDATFAGTGAGGWVFWDGTTWVCEGEPKDVPIFSDLSDSEALEENSPARLVCREGEQGREYSYADIVSDGSNSAFSFRQWPSGYLGATGTPQTGGINVVVYSDEVPANHRVCIIAYQNGAIVGTHGDYTPAQLVAGVALPYPGVSGAGYFYQLQLKNYNCEDFYSAIID